MSLGTFIRGILRKETSSTEDHGNTKSSSNAFGISETESSAAQTGPTPLAIEPDLAHEELKIYRPLLDELDARNIPYCIVGGLGVMMQSLDKSAEKVRFTRDIDIMVDEVTTNDEFIDAYLAAYAKGSDQQDRLREQLFPHEGEPSDTCSYDDENLGIEGIRDNADSPDCPKVDLVRRLNGMVLSDLSKEDLRSFGGRSVVATIDTLAEMKRRTIDMYRVPFSETSRPQDFLDLQKLESLSASQSAKAHPSKPNRYQAAETRKSEAYALNHNEAILREDNRRRPRR